jgi:hypothetical protein
VYVVCLVFNKLDRESPLKGKLADLDRQLFKARNEAMILKREVDSIKKSGTMLAAAAESQPSDVHLYKELEALKVEREQVNKTNIQCVAYYTYILHACSLKFYNTIHTNKLLVNILYFPGLN